MSYNTEILENIAEVASGGGAPQNQDDFGEMGKPFVRAGSLPILLKGTKENGLELITDEVAEKHRLRLFPQNTILFAKSGMSATKGHIYQLKSSCYVVNHLAAIVPSEKVSPTYLKYWFQVFRPSRLIQDEAYPSIRLSDIKKIQIPLPPLDEQKRIAEVLDKADALREKRRLALNKLDQLLQSVFLEMFGDPVKNPKGWEIVFFDEVCKTRLGKMLDEKKQTGKNLRPYLRNANVQWNRFDLTSVFEMDFDEREREILRLENGDLLICEGGEVGRTAIWRNELQECYYQKALHRGRPNLEKVTPEFLLYLLWFFSKNNGFKNYVTSVTIAHLTGEKLKTIKIPLPPIELQNKFAEVVKKIEGLKAKKQNALANVENLFQSLKQKAFKGELFGEKSLDSLAENGA